jgi:hypothetical protein
MSAPSNSRTPRSPTLPWQIAGVVIGAGSLIVGAVSYNHAISSSDPGTKPSNAKTGTSNSALETPHLITFPENNSVVTFNDHYVRGRGLFDGLENYILVTSEDGTDHVEDSRPRKDVGDTWIAAGVTFGQGGDCGKTFVVRLMGTHAELPPGPLYPKPRDAVPTTTDGVTVTREQCH